MKAKELAPRLPWAGHALPRALFEAHYVQVLSRAKWELSRLPRSRISAPALVNEAFLRLGAPRSGWQDLRHFLRSASLAMRHVLVDHIRSHEYLQEYRQPAGPELDEVAEGSADSIVNSLALGDVLSGLRRRDEHMARVVELHCLEERTLPEVAEKVGRPLRTLERDWRSAKHWLRSRLGP